MKPNESVEDWTKRVQLYEYGRALQQLAEGADIETVMTAMSIRITDKLMHPLFNAIDKAIGQGTQYDADESRKNYKKEYLDKIPPKPDHIKDDLK